MAKGTGNRIAVWIVVALLAFGLVGFGAAGGLGGGVRTIGSVGGKEIAVQDFANAVSQELDALAVEGQRVPFALAEQFGLPDTVLGRLVAERMLDAETDRLGLSIGDVRVRDEVIRIPGFQSLSGQFDRDTYRAALRRNGTTETAFETGIREDIARSLLQSAVIGGLPDAGTYADALTAWAGERRDVTWALVTADALAEQTPDPTEADIAAQYEANPDAYTAPETRAITYAWLTPEMLADQVTVDDADIEALYQSRIDDFVQEERRLTERLVFADTDAAEAAVAAISSGDLTFEQAVEARGLAISDTDLGDVARGDLPDDAAAAVFDAAPGTVVGPFESRTGPAIFRMNAVLAAQEVTLEDAAPDLRDELAADTARRIIADQGPVIADYLAGGQGPEDLADNTELVLDTIDWTPQTTDGIAAYDGFRDAAAAAREGDFPELQELPDGGVFVLRLDGVTPPALRPLDEVRDQVARDAAGAATQAAIAQQALTLATEVAETGSFPAPLEASDDDGVIRRNFVPGTPEGFTDRLFAMEVGEIATLPAAEGTILLRLDAVAPYDPQDETMVAERATVAERITQGMAQDIYGAYSGALRNRTEVTLDDNAVAAVLTQFR